MILPTFVALAVRYLLVVLFFPFSALDKILNFQGAVGQARQIVASNGLATALIVVGLGVEILMPLAILTGEADRLAAFIMAGYCCVTALLWKQFWKRRAISGTRATARAGTCFGTSSKTFPWLAASFC